ncbi:MAG: lipoyl synthase [Thermodesulfobacteriota bacterium]
MSLQIIQSGLTPYRRAYDQQMELLTQLHTGDREDDVCLILEHSPVFTLGRNGSPENVTVSDTFLQDRGIELIRIERGGEVTYHGPGQIVCYPIINLRRNRLTVVEYVQTLEQIMLSAVRRFGIEAKRDPRNHGIWLGDCKLGSVGIAVRHGISYHGLALNVNPDLEPFSWINPCGLSGVSMTSMARELEQEVSIREVELAMIEEIIGAFGREVKPSNSSSCKSPSKKKSKTRSAKPKWLKQRLPKGKGYEQTRRLLKHCGLNTVCQEARCPNQFECFTKGAATFMLMGENCTRNCRFCAVSHNGTAPLDPQEPPKIAAAVNDMGLQYAVLTSVTRDDLADGGAEHFARTMEAIRKLCPETLIEVLIPDLQGDTDALKHLCLHKPSVLNHNVETVAGLYSEVRPQAVYERSLELLKNVKALDSAIVTKSGLMLGLGETRNELNQTMSDIRDTGCDLLTLGQYLQPTAAHLPVDRYVPPEEFDEIRISALELGFAGVAAGPHVRSSYQAGELYKLAV